MKKIENLPLWDKHQLLARLENDQNLLENLLRIFIRQWRGLFHELQEYLGAADASRFSRAAHTMKGAAAIVEAVRIRELCLLMEKLALDGRIEEAGRLIPYLQEIYHQFLDACGKNESQLD